MFDAASLFGVRHAPPQAEAQRLLAQEAEAYHRLDPYPYYGFSDWLTEERGPFPRCLPFVRNAVRRGAYWLFGRGVRIECPDSPELGAWLRDVWDRNRMPTRAVGAAERGGYQGGVVFKWSFDAAADPAVRLQTLSAVDQVRFYCDPHDRERVLMARVQYPFWDPVRGAWAWFREEWTDAEHVTYHPLACEWREPVMAGVRWPPVATVADGRANPDLYGGWKIRTRGANPFGMIPLMGVYNLDPDDGVGIGDAWGLFRVVDRVCLTYHLMDRGNQFDSAPSTVFLDVDTEQGEIDRPLAPGQPLALKSDRAPVGEEGPKEGRVLLLEPQGKARPHMLDYAKDLRKQIVLGMGSVELDEAEITSHGNLTQVVLETVFSPLLEATELKRKTYGDDGLEPFLERLAIGLSRAGVKVPGVERLSDQAGQRGRGRSLATGEGDEQEGDVQLRWPPHFRLGEQEKTVRAARVRDEVESGLLPADRGVGIIAALEGFPDVSAVRAELEKERAAQAAAGGGDGGTGTDPEGDRGAPGGGRGPGAAGDG